MAFSLPREGLTLEVLYSPLQHTLLNPLVTGPILLGLLRYPQQIQTVFPAWAVKYLLRLTSKRCLTTLKVLLSLGVAGTINNWLSRKVLNNFTTDSWRHGKEIVLVTGAGRGIGNAIVRGIADSSAVVIALDINPPDSPLPSNAYFYKTDINNSSEIRAVAAEIREKYGEPTILVNNAGVIVQRSIFTETEAQLRNLFNVNTISHFLLAKEFVPAMAKANHGHVVTIASAASFISYADQVSYCCTKASALAFHEGLAQELKYRYEAPKVRTTVVHPVQVRSKMLSENLLSAEWKQQVPFLLEPETVADAVVKQLLSGWGAQIILPGRVWQVAGIRAWASWLQEGFRNSMKDELKSLQGGAK